MNVFPQEEIRRVMKDNFVSGLPKELKVGDIVDVWIERDDGTEYLEGIAELVEQLVPQIPKEPYIYVNLGDKDTINAIKEKWKVKPLCDSVFDDCVVKVRWIRKFHSLGIVPNDYNEEN